MRVSELMQTAVFTAMPEPTVEEAIRLMADTHVSSLPVVDAHRRIRGVISSSDVLEAEAEATDTEALGVLTSCGTVQEIMTPRAVTIGPEATVQEAARLMLYADVHRLYVVEDDRLVGVVSTTDVVRMVATGRTMTG